MLIIMIMNIIHGMFSILRSMNIIFIMNLIHIMHTVHIAYVCSAF